MDHKQKIPISICALRNLSGQGKGTFEICQGIAFICGAERQGDGEEPVLPAMSGPALPGKKRAGR